MEKNKENLLQKKTKRHVAKPEVGKILNNVTQIDGIYTKARSIYEKMVSIK
jgi:hypothetical protein